MNLQFSFNCWDLKLPVSGKMSMWLSAEQGLQEVNQSLQSLCSLPTTWKFSFQDSLRHKMFRRAQCVKTKEFPSKLLQQVVLFETHDKMRHCLPLLRNTTMSFRMTERTFISSSSLVSPSMDSVLWLIEDLSSWICLIKSVTTSYNIKKVSAEMLYRFYTYFITGLSLVHDLSTPNFKPPTKLRPQYKHLKERQEIC